MPTVYVLKLENSKWYIGLTDNLEQRIKSHFKGEGAAWTRKHKPLFLFCKLKGDKEKEKEFVLNFMSMYGKENVRGAGYSICECEYKKLKLIEAIK